MGDCDSDEAENLLSGEQVPPSAAEQPPSDAMSPPAASTSPDHNPGRNLVHDLDRHNRNGVESDRKQSEFKIGRHDQVLKREEAERSSSKEESKCLKSNSKKKGLKVSIPYKDLKLMQIAAKKIEKSTFITRTKSDCRGMMKTEVKMVKYNNDLNTRLATIFRLAGTNYARKEKGDEDYCGGEGESGSNGEDSREELNGDDEFPSLGGFKKA